MFSFLSPNKEFRAQINSDATKLTIPAGETLLKAALSAGIAWPNNCRVGSCGTCRCRLLSGKIKPLNDFSYVLDEEEMDRGMILACQTRLRSDVEVEVVLDSSAAELSIAETVQGVVSDSKPLTHDILELRIQLNQELPPYLAGQYAEISVSSIVGARSYSFARAPSLEDPGYASFYVRHVPGGEMTSWLHEGSRVGTEVTVSGPHGSFFLREKSAPILCVAGGSGLAPIKALLEQHERDGFNRPVTFLFGARTQKDLYCLEDMDRISASNENRFRFMPVLSDEPESSDWAGARGLVTHLVTEQGLDLNNCQAYLCGPPPMIDSAISILSAQGLSSDQIFFDKFLDASHLPGGKR